MRIVQLYRNIPYLLVAMLSVLVTGCCGDDIAVSDDGIPADWQGVVIRRTGFEAGDEPTRSSLIFGEGGLMFSWNVGDEMGMYPTAAFPRKDTDEKGNTTYIFDGLINANEVGKSGYWHYANTGKTNDSFFLTDPTKQQQTKYRCTVLRQDGLYAKLEKVSGTSTVNWDVHNEDTTRWTLYSPYNADYVPKGLGGSQNYDKLHFDFKGQIQKGWVNIGAFKSPSKPNGYDNPDYKKSEAEACAHLGKKDVLISAETKFSFPNTIFYLRHLGAVARFYMLAPAKDLEMVSLRLICDSKIFYTGGTFDLTSREYKNDESKGLALVGDDAPLQMSPDKGTLTNNLLLNFEGVEMKYDPKDKYSNYFVAYLMMYPIIYKQEEHGNLFVYVTAKDKDGNEVNFVTEPLADKTMKSGFYYQWTSRTNEQNGLYPIQMTATLKPWEELVGGDISADLEK